MVDVGMKKDICLAGIQLRETGDSSGSDEKQTIGQGLNVKYAP
jgi:hypothetical protein